MVANDYLNRIVNREDLSFEDAYNLFNILIEESEIRISGYLCALQTKNFTYEEIGGFSKGMRDKAVKVDFGSEVCDTCGTGGDFSSTINVSTASSIILSCFKKVAKHGNVSITSKSGSANLLEEFGIKLDISPEMAKEIINKTNYVFLYAPKYHPSLKRIMPVRRELRIKTIFNILGPLSNPSNPDYQLIGVSSPDLVEKIGRAFELIKNKKTLVVYGSGLDEVNPNNKTVVCEVVNGKLKDTYNIYPEDFGIKPTKIIPCNSPKESAERILKVFSGVRNEDFNFIVINAAACLYSANVVNDFKEGSEVVINAIDEGKVLNKLNEIKQEYSTIYK